MHPVRVTISDDLRRTRLTVAFRLVLAIPHVVWFVLWSLAALFAVVVQWFVTLFGAVPAVPLHRFICSYIRYQLHLNAYLHLVADPYPGFAGRPGSYPVDVQLPEPAAQNRWKTGFRVILMIPAAVLGSALGGGLSAGIGSGSTSAGVRVGGAGSAAAFLGWWASLFTGRMPPGLRNLALYSLSYNAQAAAYAMLVTDVYPDSDPGAVAAIAEQREHPIELLAAADEGARNRLTVAFRLLLAIPHLIWLYLWALVAGVVAIVNWLATLVRGSSPRPLHSFLESYLRYQTRVLAYITLLAEPYPDFTGRSGGYVVDVRAAAPERQSRWRTGFRLVLGIPALLVELALIVALLVVAVLGWWASLFTGRMPAGLRGLGLHALRYNAQTRGYLLLLTESYPYSGPVVAPERPL